MALNTGIASTRFLLEVKGARSGYLSSFTAPTLGTDEIKQALGPGAETKVMHGNVEIGDATFSYNMSQTGPLWEVMESVLNKNCTEFDMAVVLADQNYKGKRRIDMTGCLIKELSLPKLEAKDGKKHMEMKAVAAVSAIKFSPDSNVIQGDIATKAKNWLVSNWEPSGVPGGIPPNSIASISLPKLTAKIAKEYTGMYRTPDLYYAAWETSGLDIEVTQVGAQAATEYCVMILHDGVISAKEFVDWGVVLKDQSMKNDLCEFNFFQTAPKKFTWASELKGGQEQTAQVKIEMMLEGFKMNAKAGQG